MSRRLVSGLQQALRHTTTGLSSSSHTSPIGQAVALVPGSLLVSAHGCLSNRPFAASAHNTQPQAAASRPSLEETSADLLLPSPQQQQTIPADQYSYSDTLTEQYDVKRKPVFAVVELGPTQFKVTPNDLVYSEKLKGVDVGDQVSLNRVLLLGNTATTIIGRPHVPGATVTAVVEEQFLNGKVLIFKKRRRKNSRRLNGHRQELTGLRITDIHGLDAAS